MEISGDVVVVTGGASGLGLASAESLAAVGATVVIADLATSAGEDAARRMGATFVPADVTDSASVEAMLDEAECLGSLRAVVHCAGRGGSVRVLDKAGTPGDLDAYRSIVDVNLVGSFNVLRLAAARMSRNEPIEGERGVFVLTASIAAFEGQIGQIAYAASKAGIVGMTLVAARDLAPRSIRVCTIAPGTFDTPLLARVAPDIRNALAASVPHPSRLGRPSEFAALAVHIIENPMLNGETIRLDGALRMAPR